MKLVPAPRSSVALAWPCWSRCSWAQPPGSSREISRHLDLITDAQFPVHQAVAEVELGFKEAHQFLSHLALSPVTTPVMQSEDCKGCHASVALFSDRASSEIARVENGVAAVDGLPQTAKTRQHWPKLQKLLRDWVGQAKRLHGALNERDRLAASERTAESKKDDAKVWRCGGAPQRR